MIEPFKNPIKLVAKYFTSLKSAKNLCIWPLSCPGNPCAIKIFMCLGFPFKFKCLNGQEINLFISYSSGQIILPYVFYVGPLLLIFLSPPRVQAYRFMSLPPNLTITVGRDYRGLISLWSRRLNNSLAYWRQSIFSGMQLLCHQQSFIFMVAML